MNVDLVYPMAAMVLLTFVVLMKMFLARVRAVRAGETNASYYKTYQEGKEPREVAQLSRHIVNMFESPTLFYAACIAGMVTGQNATILVALAWVYVAMRAAHAYVHTGSNSLPPRIKIYFSSWLVLLGMWGTLVVGVATKQ
jgi:hypothetical protein